MDGRKRNVFTIRKSHLPALDSSRQSTPRQTFLTEFPSQSSIENFLTIDIRKIGVNQVKKLTMNVNEMVSEILKALSDFKIDDKALEDGQRADEMIRILDEWDSSQEEYEIKFESLMKDINDIKAGQIQKVQQETKMRTSDKKILYGRQRGTNSSHNNHSLIFQPKSKATRLEQAIERYRQKHFEQMKKKETDDEEDDDSERDELVSIVKRSESRQGERKRLRETLRPASPIRSLRGKEDETKKDDAEETHLLRTSQTLKTRSFSPSDEHSDFVSEDDVHKAIQKTPSSIFSSHSGFPPRSASSLSFSSSSFQRPVSSSFTSPTFCQSFTEFSPNTPSSNTFYPSTTHNKKSRLMQTSAARSSFDMNYSLRSSPFMFSRSSVNYQRRVNPLSLSAQATAQWRHMVEHEVKKRQEMMEKERERERERAERERMIERRAATEHRKKRIVISVPRNVRCKKWSNSRKGVNIKRNSEVNYEKSEESQTESGDACMISRYDEIDEKGEDLGVQAFMTELPESRNSDSLLCNSGFSSPDVEDRYAHSKAQSPLFEDSTTGHDSQFTEKSSSANWIVLEVDSSFRRWSMLVQHRWAVVISSVSRLFCLADAVNEDRARRNLRDLRQAAHLEREQTKEKEERLKRRKAMTRAWMVLSRAIGRYVSSFRAKQRLCALEMISSVLKDVERNRKLTRVIKEYRARVKRAQMVAKRFLECQHARMEVALMMWNEEEEVILKGRPRRIVSADLYPVRKTRISSSLMQSFNDRRLEKFSSESSYEGIDEYGFQLSTSLMNQKGYGGKRKKERDVIIELLNTKTIFGGLVGTLNAKEKRKKGKEENDRIAFTSKRNVQHASRGHLYISSKDLSRGYSQKSLKTSPSLSRFGLSPSKLFGSTSLNYQKSTKKLDSDLIGDERRKFVIQEKLSELRHQHMSNFDSLFKQKQKLEQKPNDRPTSTGKSCNSSDKISLKDAINVQLISSASSVDEIESYINDAPSQNTIESTKPLHSRSNSINATLPSLITSTYQQATGRSAILSHMHNLNVNYQQPSMPQVLNEQEQKNEDLTKYEDEEKGTSKD